MYEIDFSGMFYNIGNHLVFIQFTIISNTLM